MQREDRQEWAEAYNKEYKGFIEQGTLKLARPEKGGTMLDSADYKVTNGVFDKRGIRQCLQQQAVEDFHYKSGDLYAPVK